MTDEAARELLAALRQVLEGSFTQALEARRAQLIAAPPGGLTAEDLKASFEYLRKNDAMLPACTYVNCWHIGEHESMALWKGYGDGPYGVAIRTTAGILSRLLPAEAGSWTMPEIFVGRVRYLDYESEVDAIATDNIFAPFVCKSMAYRHDQELRAVFMDVTERHLPTARAKPKGDTGSPLTCPSSFKSCECRRLRRTGMRTTFVPFASNSE